MIRKILSFAIVFVLIGSFAVPALAAVTKDASAGALIANSPTYSAVAFDAGATSANRLLIAVVQYRSDVITLNSISYGGSAMTLLQSDNVTGTPQNVFFAYYYLVAPATGSNNFTFSVTGSGNDLNLVAYAFAGAFQGAPTLINKSTQGAATQTATVTALGGEYGVGLAASGFALPIGYSLTGDASSNQLVLNQWVTGDTNGTVASGSRTAVANYTSGASNVEAMIVLVPPPATVNILTSILGLIRAFWF